MKSKKHGKEKLKHKLKFKQSLMNPKYQEALSPKPFPKAKPFRLFINEYHKQQQDLMNFTQRNSSLFNPFKQTPLYTSTSLGLLERTLSPARKLNLPLFRFKEKKNEIASEKNVFPEKIPKVKEIALDKNIVNHSSQNPLRKCLSSHSHKSVLQEKFNSVPIKKTSAMFDSSIIPEMQHINITVEDIFEYFKKKSKPFFR